MESTLALRPVDYLHPDAVDLVARVQAEYVERYGSPDEAPIDPAVFAPPEGLFLIGYDDEEPVLTAAWRRSPVAALGGTDAVEVKRMFVVPQRRGRGFARAALAEVERTAAAAGHDLAVLETGLKQPEAIALYLSAGYVEIPDFGFYAGHTLSRCFGKRL